MPAAPPAAPTAAPAATAVGAGEERVRCCLFRGLWVGAGCLGCGVRGRILGWR